MEDLIIELLPYFGAALVSIMSFALVKVANYFGQKTKNEYVQGVLNRLAISLGDAVREVQQTTVAAIKEAKIDGKLDPTEKAAIKDVALQKVKSYMGVKGVKELVKVFGADGEALDKLLGGFIESTVFELKKGEPKSVLPFQDRPNQPPSA